MKRRIKRILIATGALTILVTTVTLTGCIHRSGGEWMFDSAPLPEGWPSITPVGKVHIKDYPTYRAAEITEEAMVANAEDANLRGMFMELFGHIKDNKIPMTAPVDMGYRTSSSTDKPVMDRMAFLYRTTDLGPTGTDGTVVIQDLPPTTYATVGVRGAYNTKNYTKGLKLVETWLANQDQYTPIGEPRFLGYNGPITLWFWRYGEVQIPVTSTNQTTAPANEPNHEPTP